MQIDLASTAIDHHEALRRCPCDHLVSQASEQSHDAGRVVKFDHEIKVVVLTCLMAE
jgi:hypothetical protein